MSSITIQKMGISDLDTDAIVNAANKEIGRCDTGSAAIRKLQNKPGSYNDFVRMAVCGMDKAAFEGLKIYHFQLSKMMILLLISLPRNCVIISVR